MVPEPEREIRERIARARLDVHPFPHLYLDRLLSDAQLSTIRAHWPRDGVFTAYSDGRNRTVGEAGRFGFYVLGHTAAKRALALDPERRAFWKQFAYDVVKPIAVGVFGKIFGTVKARFPSISELDLETFAVLVNCHKELDVRVHTDPPAFLLSIVLYVDEFADTRGGTSIYRPLEADFKHPGDDWLNRHQFRLDRTLPCRAGSISAMACTSDSYHGVEPTEIDDSHPRRTINIHTRLTSECIERLYGEKNAAGFAYPLNLETHILQSLENWRSMIDLLRIEPTPEEIAVVERSCLYGEERL